jgi:hypothetical protein
MKIALSNPSISVNVANDSQNESIDWLVNQSGWGMGGTYAFCSAVSLWCFKKSVEVWNQAARVQDMSDAARRTAAKAGERVFRDLISFVGSIYYFLGWCHRAEICALGAYAVTVWKVAYGCTAFLAALSIKRGLESSFKIASKIKVVQPGAAREGLEQKQNAKLLLVAANVALCTWAVLIASSAASKAVLSGILGVGCVLWLSSFAYSFFVKGHWAELQRKVDQLLGITPAHGAA